MPHSITYMWNLKNNNKNTNEIISKKKKIQTENKVWNESRGGIDWEFGIKRYTVLYIYKIDNMDLLYSKGNHIHYLLITYHRKWSEIYLYYVP